jgi:hypothetical protein
MVLHSTLRTGEGRGRAAIWIFVFALIGAFVGLPRTASAVPSFASQTGVPCAQCHVIGFGPSLTEYGRQFKLNGYTFKKPDSGLNIPLALTAIAGYENLSKNAPAPSPYSDKENLYLQAVSGYIAGGLTDHLGAFAKVTYDGVAKHTAWDKLDVRYARPLELGGHSLVAGITVNNYPGVQDLWNALPTWGYPYVRPAFTPFPNDAPKLGLLSYTVLGGSAYAMIDNRVYAELGFYRGLSDKWLGNLGDGGSSPNIVGAVPYARLTYQQHNGSHYFAAGFTFLNVKQQPNAPQSGETNRYSDFALDGTYQFNVGSADAFDAHVSWIHEDRHLDASFASGGSDAVSNSLNTVAGDVSYVMKQTWVSSVGLFATSGSTNRLMYAPAPIFGSAAGTPNTRGYLAQIEWVPFGKVGAWASPWVNLRLALQYTGYFRFNGGSSNYDGFGRNASDNNTVFVFAWLAF